MGNRQVGNLYFDPDKFHKPGQFTEHFLPYTRGVPEWMINLGPGSGTEYLEARAVWPDIRLLIFEPSHIGYPLVRERIENKELLASTKGVSLENKAIWDSDQERAYLYKALDLNHGTLFEDWDRIMEDNPNPRITDNACNFVETRTLDSIDVEHGPINNAVLWMDVEGSERRVLKGARRMLSRGAVKAINIEMRPQIQEEVGAILKGYNMRRVYCYFECATYRDEVWILRE